MIPLRDVIPSRTTPFLTVAIIAANAAAWFFELSLSRGQLSNFLQQYGVVPANFSVPTLFTSMFLHGSWFHVLGNMWYLWIFGDNVEDRMGHGRFLVFYLLWRGGRAGPDGHGPAIHAADHWRERRIAGVMGAYFVLYPQSRADADSLIVFWEVIELPAIFLLGFWFLMQLFSAGSIAVTANTHGGGGVAFMANVAGFLTGIVGVFVFRKRQYAESRWM